MALSPHGSHAGNASAVLGFLQFGVSAAGGILVSALQNGSALPMAGLMAGGGLVAATLLPLTGRNRSHPTATAPPAA